MLLNQAVLIIQTLTEFIQPCFEQNEMPRTQIHRRKRQTEEPVWCVPCAGRVLSRPARQVDPHHRATRRRTRPAQTLPRLSTLAIQTHRCLDSGSLFEKEKHTKMCVISEPIPINDKSQGKSETWEGRRMPPSQSLN